MTRTLWTPAARHHAAMIVVVMGVAGSGKTAIGRALAARLGWRFEDADAFHPPANVEKMRHGIPLTDDDREPWMHAIARAVAAWIAAGEHVVLACSALRRRHRDLLRSAAPVDAIRFVYLHGDANLIATRLRARTGHFMPASLLASQVDALEPPDATEALAVDVAPPIPAIVDEIVRGLVLAP